MSYLFMIPPVIRQILLLIYLVVLLIEWIIITLFLLRNTDVKTLITEFLLFLLNCIIFNLLIQENKLFFLDASNIEHNTVREYCVSFILLVIVLFSLFLFVFHFNKEFRNENNSISIDSIREALDTMDAGLCFYQENGLPILMNQVMEDISQLLMGQGLLNGNTLWEYIEAYPDKIDAFNPTIVLSNGKVYTFFNQLIEVEKMPVYQLLASDVSDIHQLNQQIQNDNKKLENMNHRLRLYNDNMSEVTKEEEILLSKEKIHKELGDVLWNTKFYLNSESDVYDLDELLEMWNLTVRLLKNEISVEQSQSITYLLDAGRVVDIQVHFEGSIVNWDNQSIKILNMAVREILFSMSQTSQKDLYIQIEEGTYFHLIKISGVDTKDVAHLFYDLEEEIEKIGGRYEISDSIKLIIPRNGE